MPVVSTEKKVSLPQEALRGMLRRTSFATSTDESRYVLNGLFFSLREHKLTVVATDGRRLAMAEQEVDIPQTSQADLIVPSKAVAELNRLLQEQGDVEITFSENQAVFTLKDEKGFPVVIMTSVPMPVFGS